MSKTCLIIDDNHQDAIIETIEYRLKNKNIDVKCLQFNVGSLERKDLMTDERLDMAKILEAFKKEFAKTNLDLICIDYSFDDPITGLDILKAIYPSRQTSAYMLFSSHLDKLTREIFEGYVKDPSDKKSFETIKFLAKHKIVDFVSRNNYNDVVVGHLGKEEQTLEMMLEQKLLEYSELVFQNTYPPFEGRTLMQIVDEIRKGTVQGKGFTKEILEQTIANMILINS